MPFISYCVFEPQLDHSWSCRYMTWLEQDWEEQHTHTHTHTHTYICLYIERASCTALASCCVCSALSSDMVRDEWKKKNDPDCTVIPEENKRWKKKSPHFTTNRSYLHPKYFIYKFKFCMNPINLIILLHGDKERCDMCSFGLVEDQSCCCILNHL